MTVTELYQPLKRLSRADKLKVMQFLIGELTREEASNEDLPEDTPQISESATLSALDLAGDLVGCLDSGLGDLSSNPAYMEGFGS